MAEYIFEETKTPEEKSASLNAQIIEAVKEYRETGETGFELSNNFFMEIESDEFVPEVVVEFPNKERRIAFIIGIDSPNPEVSFDAGDIISDYFKNQDVSLDVDTNYKDSDISYSNLNDLDDFERF